ncbi:MAG TPA: winged helix-turn-helix domain-containing protein [Bryobacteraceae bacterium]|nr:winged helix-turn-helix domain-containing protein [Bryobacteraceae bacterium]
MQPAIAMEMETEEGSLYRDAHLRIDFARRRAALDSKPLVLTGKEFELLAFLVQHAGVIISPTALLTNVWGYSTEVRTRTLDVHLSRLRKLLRPYGEVYLERVFRVGCRFQPCGRELPLTA